jgi:ketosteroid isomerase-like protein
MTNPILEQRVAALEDRNAIIELCASYNRGVDSYDEGLWMSVWHEDAEYLIGETFGNHSGHAELKAILHTLREYFSEMHHYATNIVVTLEGDTATALVDADVTATDRGGRAMMLAASYRDRFERRKGGWRFARREVDLHYAAPVARPWTLDPATRFVLDA